MRFDGVRAFGYYNSTETEAIWIKSGVLWVHCRALVLLNFERDSHSSESGRAWRIFAFWQVSNPRFHRFPVQPNITKSANNTWIGVAMKALGTEFWKFSRKESFFSKNRQKWTLFGRPFVKRYALCYRSAVCLSCQSCLSVTLVHCGQTVGRIKVGKFFFRLSVYMP